VLAFSDAVFAIAITLLTLNLEVPPGLHGADLTRALHQVLPAFGAYVLSFVILGQLWLAHHRNFGVIAPGGLLGAGPQPGGRLLANDAEKGGGRCVVPDPLHAI
jgi:hypothetical protein